MLKLKLLGTPEVRLNGAALTLPPKRLALLAYLALESSDTHPLKRTGLCDMLWSEQGPEAARRNLRQELHRLKQTPLAGFLHSTPETLGLAVESCDVRAFEAACDDPASGPDAALTLYGGPLLQDLDLAHGGAFEDWLGARRGELHARWLALRRRWATHLEAAGELTAAVGALEPLRAAGDEAAYVQSMRLQARLGEGGAALQTYRTLAAQLESLGLTPAPETAALYGRLRGATAPAPAASRASLSQPPLIGRAALLTELQGGLEAGGLLLLEGEPGSGKTAVAAALMERWGFGLRLQGREEAQATPFLAVVEVLRAQAARLPELPPAWRRELARLLPELDEDQGSMQEPGEGGEGRTRLLEALSGSLRQLLQAGLLWLDDLHWFDPSSLEVLGLALRAEPWRAIATVRPLERRQNAALEGLLSALERRRAVTPVALPPLTETDTLRLVRTLSASAGGGVRFARRLHTATQGNPLFVLETLRTLLESGQVRGGDEGGWHTDFDDTTQDYRELPLPGSVRSAVIARLGRLEAATGQLLMSAALLGESFGLDELAGSTPLDAWAQLSALEQALEAGLVRTLPPGAAPHAADDAPRYQFSHQLVQRALTLHLSAERRRWLHRQLAATLERLGARAARLAVHLEGAGRRAEAAAMRLRAAQEAAEVYAHPETLEHLDAALRLGLDARESFEAQLKRAEVCSLTDDKRQWEAALDAARAAAQGPDDLRRVELRFCELEFHLGRYPAVLERVARLWALPDLSAEQRGWAGLWAGNAESRTARLHEAVDWYGRALVGVPEGELILRGRLLNAWAYALYVLGELEEGQKKVQAAMEHFVQANYKKGQVMAHNTAGSLEYKADKYRLALQNYQSSYCLSQATGDLPSQCIALTNLCEISMKIGDIEQSLFYINSGLELISLSPDPYVECLFLENLSEIYAIKGQLDKVLSNVNKCIKVADSNGIAYWSAAARILKLKFLKKHVGGFKSTDKAVYDDLELQIKTIFTKLPGGIASDLEKDLLSTMFEEGLAVAAINN